MRILYYSTAFVLLILLIQTVKCDAQIAYNPFTQNIHFTPEPSINGFSCGQIVKAVFTQGITTADNATQFATNPLKVKICYSGFIRPSNVITNLISGTYASNFNWTFDPNDSNCVIGTQNQVLLGTGPDPLNPNLQASGTIELLLKVPNNLTSITNLSVNTTLIVPSYMQTFNSTPDDVESSTTQSYCNPIIACNEAPKISIWPNENFCVGDNIVIKAYGENGATFQWTTPSACTGIIDNSVPGVSSIHIDNISELCNGIFKVTQLKNNCTTYSLSDSISINTSTKALINYVTSQCVNNQAQVTVTASHSNSMPLQYSINGGAFSSNNTLNSHSGSTYFVAVKPLTSNCVSYYSGNCVQCPPSGNSCSNPPLDSMSAPKVACTTSPIMLQGFFSNASSITWISSGDGTFSQSNCNTSGCSTAYFPGELDNKRGFVSVSIQTDDPDGITGPCAPAVCFKHIKLINGLVAPTLASNSPVCVGSDLNLSASGHVGSIIWNPTSYVGSQLIISPATSAHSGNYTATNQAFGCQSIGTSLSVSIVPSPILSTTILAHNEACFGTATGSLEVSVSGGSGLYKINYDGPQSSCKSNSIGNEHFKYLPPGTYTITISDMQCQHATTSYIRTIAAGEVVSPPIVDSTIKICSGEALTLQASSNHTTVEWSKSNSSFHYQGKTLIFNQANASQSGIYSAKAISNTGCASLPSYVNVQVAQSPKIQTIQVNCNNQTADVSIIAHGSNLEYSVDGISFYEISTFTSLTSGYKTAYVRTLNSTCMDTMQFFVQNCACTQNTQVQLEAPQISCGLTPIPIQGSFTNANYATFSSTGSGTFSTNQQSSPFLLTYTPSVNDIALGFVYISALTDDFDATGPCTPILKRVLIHLTDSLAAISLATNAPSYCQGDSLVLYQSQSNLPGLWYAPNGTSIQNYVFTKGNLEPLDSGYYQFEISGNGCQTQKDSIFIQISPAPLLSISATTFHESCNGQGNGKIQLNITGGSGRYYIEKNGFVPNHTVVSPFELSWLTPSVYTINVMDSTCANYKNTQEYTINPGQTVSPPHQIIQPNSLCKGEAFSLIADGPLGSNYSWFHVEKNKHYTGDTLSFDMADTCLNGHYRLQRMENGCASEYISASVIVDEKPKIHSIDTLCDGSGFGSLVINASNSNELLYSINDGTYQSSNEFVNLSNGLYKVSVKSPQSACDTTLYVTLNCHCDCNKPSATLFPNPSNGQFSLKLYIPESNSELSYRVMDMSGRLILNKTIHVSENQLLEDMNLTHAAKSQYILQIQSNGEKLIIPLEIK